MARKPVKRRVREPEHHWLTLVALACIVLFVATVAVANAFGWPALIPGPLGIIAAILAIAAAGFAFSLWEHVRLFARERRWPNFIGAGLLFVGALTMDAVGVHSGIDTFAAPWRAELARQAEIDRTAQQSDLGNRRSTLQNEIDAIQARIDAVPLDRTGGPQNRAANLASWNAQTANDRERLEGKQRTLDALPRQIEAAAVAPWLSPAMWAFALFAEFIVAFGVSVLGIEIAPQFAAARDIEQPEPKPAPEPLPANVTPIRAARPVIRRDASRWSGWD